MHFGKVISVHDPSQLFMGVQRLQFLLQFFGMFPDKFRLFLGIYEAIECAMR